MSLELSLSDADIFVPDGSKLLPALERTTHLAIGAHQDDLEFMAAHGIFECFGSEERWFTGVTVTNGAGSARAGRYAAVTDHEMQGIRIAEQRKAAHVGEYSCVVQLGASSVLAKDFADDRLTRTLETILIAAKPQVVYLHNPCDRHDTHVACCMRGIEALRRLPESLRPQAVFGCEVWRDLDWLPEAAKVHLPVDSHPHLAAALNGVFDSQIAGGKRYDLAVQGRRAANATFSESHELDAHQGVTFAMDLLVLLERPELSVEEFTVGLLKRMEADIIDRIRRMKA